MLPLVSVIVTSFNHAKFIAKSLDSIFAQTYKNLEVIVVDDASTDGSQNIIKKYQRKHAFQFIERKENQFSCTDPECENPGIEAMLNCNGKYIAVVDSDDFIYPDKISMQVEMMEKNESAVLCYGGIQVLNENGSRHKYNDRFPDGDVFESLLTYGNHILFIGSLIRKTAFLTIEKTRKDIMQVDWDVFLKLAKKGPFIADKRTVACYRRHENNTWYKADKELLMYKNRMMVLDCWKHEDSWPAAMNTRWAQYIQQKLLDENAVDTLLTTRPEDALVHFLKFKNLFENKKINEAEKYLSLALKYCDNRLAILPGLYKLMMNFMKDEQEISVLLDEMNHRV